MKKGYGIPELDVVACETEDILINSTDIESGDGSGGDYGEGDDFFGNN